MKRDRFKLLPQEEIDLKLISEFANEMIRF